MNETIVDSANGLTSPEQEIVTSDLEAKTELPEEASTESVPAATLSKKAQKRLEARERFLSHRLEKRKQEREKRKEARRKRSDEEVSYDAARKRLKDCTMANSACRVHVTIDMSFDHLMTPKDLGKCIKQIQRCYSINRRLSNPLQFHVTSFSGENQREMSKNNGFRQWDVNFHSESYTDIFPKDKIVYLTSESENVLKELEDDTYYIIGGLVDHNAQKGLCHEMAVAASVRHARLPIGEEVFMSTRKVLTIDHVFNIVALVTQKSASWKEALLQVMPKRKGAVDCQQTEDSQEEANAKTLDSE